MKFGYPLEMVRFRTGRVRSVLMMMVALLALAACASTPQATRQSTESLEDQIGEMMIVAATGSFMNERSPSFQRLLGHVQNDRVGGVIWYAADVYETAWVNHKLQEASDKTLLISADLESGLGMRFANTTFWPWAMAMAATGDAALVEEQGRIVAREARLLGINHIYAPVADVNSNPDNPVINVRSYGEDPALVATMVSAFIRGVESEGVLATVKHFPGHGDTHTDSHRSLPSLEADIERLERLELIPFRAAIEAGVSSVMLAHMGMPAIDPARLESGGRVDANPYAASEDEVNREATVPASLSGKIIDGLLREELGFDGVVITDALDMGGITDHFDAGEAAIRAVEAGSDLILKTASTRQSIDALIDAVESGRISRERISLSIERIRRAKTKLQRTSFSNAEIFAGVDQPENKELAQRAAQKALTLVRNGGSVLPLQSSLNVAVLTVGDFRDEPNVLSSFHSGLRSRLETPPVTFRVDRRSSSAPIEEIEVTLQESELVIVASTVRVRSGQGAVSIPDVARGLIEGAIERGQPVLAISFGNPYLLREIPGVPVYIAAYGVQPVMQRAAVKAIFGEEPFTGRLPVTIPDLAARGAGVQLPASRR